jgi:hypothetical protein
MYRAANCRPDAEERTMLKQVEFGRVETPYGLADILVGRYPSGGAICVALRSAETGEALGTFSTNLRPYGHETGRCEFHAKVWEENAPLVEPMLKTGLFVDTGKRATSGFVEAQVWMFTNPAQVP